MIELVPWLSKPAAGSSKQELPSQVGNWRLFLLAAADELLTASSTADDQRLPEH